MKNLCTSLSIVGLAFIVSAAFWFEKTHRVPPINVVPISKDASRLTQPEVERILANRFEVVSRVRQISPALKQSFSDFTGLPFDMNDPGEPMSTDVIIDAPSRQLIFAAVGEDCAVVVYEQGGFASTPNVVVLSYSNEPRAWAATLTDYPPRDISGLQKTLRASRFIAWKRM